MKIELSGKQVTFGLQYNFRNPAQWRRPWFDVYQETLDHISVADELGFDVIWTTEHHLMDDGYSPSILPLCAAIASRTTRVRIGTRVLLAPFYDPLRLAEDAATVDLISGGRLILGLGLGYRQEEYDALGVPTTQRGRKSEELVAILRQAWAPGTMNFSGQFHTYQGLDVTPKPVQQPIPIWLGGGTELAGERAGRLGAEGLHAEGAVARKYREVLDELHPGSVSKSSMSVPWFIVAEDIDKAWDIVGQHVMYQHHTTNEWMAANGRPPLVLNLPPDASGGPSSYPDMVVTPARAREIVIETVARSATEEIVIGWQPIPSGVPPKLTQRSLELFADEMFKGR